MPVHAMIPSSPVADGAPWLPVQTLPYRNPLPELETYNWVGMVKHIIKSAGEGMDDKKLPTQV